MKRILLALIRGYKKHLSPHLGNHCRFSPTCSEYACEAISTHGSAKGLLLAIWRLLRCNPFGKAGYDPPPEKGRWRHPGRRLRRE
jgi:putative membrane protein insertion efficiency factor